MESPVRLYAAAIVVPEPVAGTLRALQEMHRLPAWEPNQPLHITLVPPFTTRETEEALVAQWVSVVHRAPFPVRLIGFGRFDNRASVFYAAVEPTPPLTTLADDALAALPRLHNRRMHPFLPHVTLAAAASRDIVDGYMRRLSESGLHEEFMCDRCSMLRLDEPARQWEVLRDFPFIP